VADHVLVACDELQPASELGLQDVNGQ
jgi:hypothetical protein